MPNFFPKWIYHFTSLSKIHESSGFSTPCQYLVALELILGILAGNQWYLIAVLICISLKMNDIVHCFMHLLTIICLLLWIICLNTLSTFNWVIRPFIIELWEFSTLIFCEIYVLQIFFPVCASLYEWFLLMSRNLSFWWLVNHHGFLLWLLLMVLYQRHFCLPSVHKNMVSL